MTKEQLLSELILLPESKKTDLLADLLSQSIEALELIERAYPLSGERMAHQNYAAKTLEQIKCSLGVSK